MVIRNLTTLFGVILIASMIGGSAGAIDVEYIGAITDGLHSPTSVVASNDVVAVLDPYASSITLFSPDGPIIRKIHLPGDAHSLIRLSETMYAFCDRSRQAVIAYDMAADRQYDYIDPEFGLIDPVDLVFDGVYLHILDAGQSAISVADPSGDSYDKILLKDESGEPLKFASSLAYDSKRRLYYVMDQTNSRICRFDSEGHYLGSLASFGSKDGQITRGGEIEFTDNDLILVTDRYQGRVSVFDDDGAFRGSFGAAQIGETPLSIPTGISVDENGLIYVVSTMGASISVYYLPPAADDAEVSTAIQQFPEDGSEINRERIILETFVEAYHAADRVKGFEFQIFGDSETDIPLTESPLVSSLSYIDLQGDRQRVSASWSPEWGFHEDTVYWWRSRVHTNDSAGFWTARNSFTIENLPRTYRLDQNVPNPFNPETRLSFNLGDESDVVLEVINILGQKIRNLVEERLPSGDYQVIWDGTDDEGRQSASGIYFYRLRAGDFTQTRKMVLLR